MENDDFTRKQAKNRENVRIKGLCRHENHKNGLFPIGKLFLFACFVVGNLLK